MFLAGRCKGAGRGDFEESVETYACSGYPSVAAAAQSNLQVEGRRCGGRDCEAAKSRLSVGACTNRHGYQVPVVD